MQKKVALPRIIYLLALGAVIFISVSACREGIDKDVSSPLKPVVEECRLISHSNGETCVPIQPKRIITLDIFSLGNAVTLGINPIAGGLIGQESEHPAYLKKYAMNVDNIGHECQPNVEKIILLKPDLILGRSACSQNYEVFSKVAPTVFSGWYINTHWRENFDLTSKVLGEEAAAQAAWKEYSDRIKELRSRLTEQQQSKKISVVHVHAFALYAHTKNSFAGSILGDLGLKRPGSQDVDADYGYVEVSKEELQRLDGDILFALVGNVDDEKFLDSLKREPLWQKLNVAQTGQVYAVKDNIWWGGNLLAANLVLDDLEKYLINTP